VTSAEDFSPGFSVQTGSGAQPSFLYTGYGGSFPGSKALPGRVADHSPFSTAEVKKEQELYFLHNTPTPSACMEFSGTTVHFTVLMSAIRSLHTVTDLIEGYVDLGTGLNMEASRIIPVLDGNPTSSPSR
jgi:hypothetical protein